MNKINLISIAQSPEELEYGMKFRKALPEDAGMLFKFKSPRLMSFWMKDTYVPLDIAFIDENGTIVKTESMVPLSLRSVRSDVPCVMALEVLAGTLAKMNVSIGSKVVIDENAKAVSFENA